MKLLVCGGRKFWDVDLICDVLEAVHKKRKITLLIHGDASGADRIAGEWARSSGIHACAVQALWPFYKDQRPNPAGPIRNEAMLMLQPDGVVAFPGGAGTAHMVRIAKEAGLKVMEIKPRLEPPDHYTHPSVLR
jgi:hypothetical protein